MSFRIIKQDTNMKSQLQLTWNASCEFICFNDSRYIWPNYVNSQETPVFLTGRISLKNFIPLLIF